jgi:hypothetical protein
MLSELLQTNTVRLFLQTDVDNRLLCLLNGDIGLTECVTDRQGMLIPLSHMVPTMSPSAKVCIFPILDS